MKKSSITSSDSFGKQKVYGGFLGDKDKRTRRSFRSLTTTAIASSVIIAGLISFKVQLNNYHYYMINNTTPIGTELSFAKSKAVVKISDVWTDYNRDLTVVKLKYDNSAYQLLSTNGDKYNLYVATKNGEKPKISLKYGILGTEGDGFLFIKGKLPKKAYQIFLANQVNHISTSANAKETGEINANLETNSIEKMLSQHSSNDVDETGIFKFKSSVSDLSENQPDNINFRINPYSKTTNIFNGSFLNNDGDIDYEKVIEVTSVNELTQKLEKQVASKEKKIEQMRATISEYQERLLENPNDTNSKNNISSLKNDLKTIEVEKQEQSRLLLSYKTSTFSEKSFGKTQDKFKFLTFN